METMRSMKIVLSVVSLSMILGVSSEETLDFHFTKFMKDHNRKYSDSIEEAFRKGIFAANLEKINRHNEEYDRGDQSWKMSVNAFADLTHDEFMEMLTLKVPDMPKANNKYQMQGKSLAGSVDWRDTSCVGNIKDQGQCGSCWAFAAVASVEFECCMTSGNHDPLSEQQVMDCADTGNGCNGGWYDQGWKYLIEAGGIEKSSDYPYSARVDICRADPSKFECSVTECYGGPNKFGPCENGGLVGDEEEFKKMLNDHPLAVTVDATPFQFYSSGILDCRTFHSLNHAVFAVGYEEGSHYIVKNSWGASWGESGYIKIGMGGNPCGIADYPAYAVSE